MNALISIVIQLLGGGAGGHLVAGLLKNLNIPKLLATITGLVGGVAGGQLAAVLGIIQKLMEALGNTGGEIAGNAGASAIGGALLTAIVGFIKNAMGAKA